MSFLDVVWARLGIDPVEAGVRLIDGHVFAPRRPALAGAVLVAHTHANWVLSDIKLGIDDPSGALDDTPVVLLQGARHRAEADRAHHVVRDGPGDRGRPPDVAVHPVAGHVRSATDTSASISWRERSASSARGTSSRRTARCSPT